MDLGIRTNHISKVLSELKSKEIVECINEEARKGRLYRLTDTGKEVLETIKEKEVTSLSNEVGLEIVEVESGEDYVVKPLDTLDKISAKFL